MSSHSWRMHPQDHELEEHEPEQEVFIQTPGRDKDNNTLDIDDDSETEKLIETYFSTKRTCCQILLFVVLFLLGVFAGFFVHEAAIEENGKSCATESKPSSNHQKELEKLREMHRSVIGNMSASDIQTTADFLAKQYSQMSMVEDSAIADYITKKFKSFESFDNVDNESYEITLSYPVIGHPSSLQIINAQDVVVYSKSFEYEGERSYSVANGTSEDVVTISNNGKDEAEDTQNVKLPMFYAYSKGASAQGEVVYLHYGRKEDFERVDQMAINMTGKIVLMRYGRNRLNEKVMLAEQFGAVGALFYLDPQDKRASSEDWYATPQGIADPYTYGFPAKDGYLSQPIESALTSIPVQPISTQDAFQIMANLAGKKVPDSWQGGMNVTYYIGRKSQSTAPWKLHMEVKNEKVQKTLYNVIGTIAGYADGSRGNDRFVMIGSHRGVMDNYNGTAIMLEIARNLNRIRKGNWKPKRTIKMCSWGVVHGVLGSVEWAEAHKRKLSRKAVVYIDVDMPVQGDYVLQVEATESLSRIIPTVANMISDPGARNSSVFKSWMDKSGKKKPIELLGHASDYLVFPHQLGIATINMQYVPSNHTQVDEYYTPPKFIDTDFVYHKLMCQLYGQAILSLSDATMLQFDFEYTHVLINDYLAKLNDKCASHIKNTTQGAVRTALGHFKTAVKKLHTHLTPNGDIYDDAVKLRIVNDLLTQLERNFVVDGGRDYGDQMYRHILYSKRAYNTFPALAEVQDPSADEWNCDTIEDLLSIIQYSLDSAVDLLTPDDNVWWWGN
ncbi:N-acetylated-alpha-linked acidic dipeptidase 2-like [Glandiceps talaboti]